MKNKAVLYCRFSSSKQQESSIEGQIEVCSNYAKQNGYEIVNTYVDRETSAFKDVEKRSSFLKMIKDSQKGEFSFVIVYALDRFSRNKYETAIYENKLSLNNVELLSATEPTSNTPEGRLMRSLLEGMAQFYSENLSQKVKRGNVVHAKQCHFLGGFVPFGYKIVNKCFELDPVNVEYVKYIFKEYSEGAMILDLADYLNSRGVKTPMGRTWNRSSFHSILTNKKYIGIYEYVENGEKKEIENGVPRIIDDKLFYQVQELYKSHEHRKKRASQHLYLLSNKLYCSCGYKMCGSSSTSKTKDVHYYYLCQNDKKRYREKALNDLVLNAIDEIKSDSEIRKSLVDIVFERLNKNDDSVLDSLNSQYEVAHKEYKNLLKNLSLMDDLDEDMRKLITDKKNECEELKTAISYHTPVAVTYKEVQEFFDFVFEQKENYSINLVNTLIYKVVVRSENDVDIYLNAPVSSASTFRWRSANTIFCTLNFYIRA